MAIFFIPILVCAFGWLLVWGIAIIPFKWPYLADQWVGKIDLTKIIPELTENNSFEALKPMINEKLDEFFRHTLSAKLPIISMFIGHKTIEELKVVFMDELAILFPILITQFSSNLNQDLQQHWEHKLSKIVQQKINKASIPVRWVAFVLGMIWGTIIALILPYI